MKMLVKRSCKTPNTKRPISDILGISRQTYSAIETKKRKMTWNMFISLLMFSTQNKKTAPVIEMIGAFPDELKNMMNVDYRR